MPKVTMTLTKAERKAGVDLRDVIDVKVKRKPPVSAETKRELAFEAAVRASFAEEFGEKRVKIEGVEASERDDSELEIVIRLFVSKADVDDVVKHHTRVRGSRS